MTSASSQRSEAGTAPRVVFLHTRRPPAILGPAIRAVRSAGGTVTVAGLRVQGGLRLDTEPDRSLVLRSPAAAVPLTDQQVPTRWSVAWASVVLRNLYRRLVRGPVAGLRGPAKSTWAALRRDPDALQVVDEADVLVATDAGAVHAVWQCSRRNRSAAAVNGIGPALEELGLAD